MTKLLRIVVLLSVLPVLAFGQRGGARAGGGARPGGSGGRIGAGVGGGSVMRGGGGAVVRGGGFASRGNVIFRGGSRIGGNVRFYGGRSYYPYSYYYPSFYLGFGYGGGYGSYPYYSPYYDPYSYSAPYDDYVGYVPAPPAPPAPPSPPAVINQTIGTPSGANLSGSFYRAADFYLIAFNDHVIQAALSYTVEGDQLHYTTREHEEKTVPLSSVDRRFSEQINRDRRVEFKLP